MSRSSLLLRLLILGLLAPFLATSVVHAQPPAVAAVPAEWTLASNDLGVLSRVYPSLGFTLPNDIKPEDANTAQAVYRAWTQDTDLIGVFTAELSDDRAATALLESFVENIDPTACGAEAPLNVTIGCSGNRQYGWWQAGDRVNIVFGTEPTAFLGLLNFQLELGAATEPVIPASLIGTIFRIVVVLGLLTLFAMLAMRIQKTIRQNQNTPSYRAGLGRDSEALLATEPTSSTLATSKPVPTPPSSTDASDQAIDAPLPTFGSAPASTGGGTTNPAPTAAAPAAMSEFFDVNELETNNFGDDGAALLDDATLESPMLDSSAVDSSHLDSSPLETAVPDHPLLGDPLVSDPPPPAPPSDVAAAEPLAADSLEELPELVFDRPFPAHRMAEAAASPEGWVFDIDPSFDLSGDVPPEAILGAWAIDADGQPTGEYLVNPREEVSS